MTSVIKIGAEEIVNSLQDQKEVKNKGAVGEEGCENHNEICAICLDNILLQETALVKGCEHAYCVTCILRWASYSLQTPSCPQCKRPFELLNVHRSLDGRVNDYMSEESVCLLLRATWFREEVCDDMEDYYCYYYQYEDEDEDDEDEVYYNSSPSSRIGNTTGLVRSERQEARPVQRSNLQDSGAGSSREPKNKEASKRTMGRRAKRALKREAADKAAAAKHQQHLVRLGRK